MAGPDQQTTLHLEECDNIRAQQGLLAGDYDAILFVSDGALPQIEYEELLRAPAYCLMPQDHPLASQPSVLLKDLAKQKLVVLNLPVAVDYYRRLFDETLHPPETVAYASSTEMVRSMVGAGHGIAVLNMLPNTDVSYSGDRLTARPIANDLPPLTLSLGYDKSFPRRIVVQFAKQCQSYFGNGGGKEHCCTDPSVDGMQ